MEGTERGRNSQSALRLQSRYRASEGSQLSERDPVVAEGLVRRFGDVVAVAGIDLSVARGEIFGFLGPNGAGKSTTVRMLTTLLRPTAGRAWVAGHDITAEADAVRRSIGVALQDAALDPLMTGRELLNLQAVLHGIPPAEGRGRSDKLLHTVGLTAAADRRVGTYSGGMKRRLDLALALMHEPEVMFLDEPTTGLDPNSRAALWEEIRELNAGGTTVFLTTQYMEEADRLCARIAIVDHGQLAALGSPLTLKASIPGKNFLEVSFSEVPDAWNTRLASLPHVEDVTSEGHVFRLASGNGPATTTALMGAAAEAGVAVQSLSVHGTTLDDVFVHYTGSSLRDALQAPSAADSPFMLRRG